MQTVNTIFSFDEKFFSLEFLVYLYAKVMFQ